MESGQGVESKALVVSAIVCSLPLTHPIVPPVNYLIRLQVIASHKRSLDKLQSPLLQLISRT